jgi:hypothetical protein
VPTNDLWIAAVAVETGSRLLSDDSHFDGIPGVSRTCRYPTLAAAKWQAAWWPGP